MFKNRVLNSALFVLALIILGALTGIYTSDYYRRADPGNIPGLLWPEPKQLRPFATIDQDQNVFGLDRLQNKWSFVFFGYTHCPDVCPLTMATLDETYRMLQQSGDAEDVQVILVSVDPERDSSEVLKSYTAYFNPGFIGLGGNMSQVESLTRQIGIAWFHHEQDAEGNYLVDHSASIFLIDPQARLLAVFGAPHDDAEIRKRFRDIRDFYRDNS